MKKKKTSSAWDAIRHIRGDWGAISPVTKVIPNKKKNRKPRHKKHMYEEE